MKMVSVIWFLSFLAFLVADVQISASQEKDLEPRRCYQCLNTNQTSECDQLDTLSSVTCPPELPYCATTATSPDYTSSLKCSVGGQTPCTLIHKAKDTYEMICTCTGHICNAPFNRDFRNELLNFSYTNLSDNTTGALTKAFINSTSFAKTAAANLYEAITLTREATTLTAVSPSTSISNVVQDMEAPRAEALKHEATVPPDDDEDESEGSGSFDDVKPQIPAAPAAPSSFLPENENKAIPVHINLLATVTLLLVLYIVA